MNTFRVDLLLVILYNLLHSKETTGQQAASAQDAGFGPWSEWSTCTAECGTGVISRTRECQSQDDISSCRGNSVQFKLCNTQECIRNVQFTLREKLCSSHNDDLVSSRTYHWLPYMKDSCELTCRARGYGFYKNFGESVTNGTICKKDGKSVCVQGKCKSIGCDGVVGSNGKVDRCGLCNGDNSTCHIMEGVFEETDLSHAYVFVKTIPAGSTFINITQLARSRNYLAIRAKNGPYYINGNRRLSRQGSIEGKGIKFHYHRRRTRRCPGECILADGPLTEDIDIMLLTFGNNYGIRYRYAYPNNETSTISNQRQNPGRAALEETASHVQTLDDVHIVSTENFFTVRDIVPTPPSTVRETAFDLEPTDEAIIVEDDFQIPPTQIINSDKSEQNVTSQNGSDAEDKKRLPSYTQSFGFMDKMKSNKNENRNTQIQGSSNNQEHRSRNPPSDTPLADKRQPTDSIFVVHPNEAVYVSGNGDVTRSRQRYQWKIVGYSECSRECGTGYKLPEIQCMAFGRRVHRGKCRNVFPRPRTERVPCNTHPCRTRIAVRWEIGDWSRCSVTCGTGQHRRDVRCVTTTENGVVAVSENECPYSSRPDSTESCKMQDCYRWSTGQWGECSVTCGRGFKSRSVRCIAPDNRPAQVSLCDQVAKPIASSGCDVRPCESSFNDRSSPNTGSSSAVYGSQTSWYFTHWTTECGDGCGQGTQRRDVRCLREGGYVSPPGACSYQKPPVARECKSRDRCGAFWFTGPWGQCNVTCGKGAQTRPVLCVRRDSRGTSVVVPNHNCDSQNKPAAVNACQMASCRSDWYMTPWGQCSVTCGTGVATRDVKCLDVNHRMSNECGEASKPNYRQECIMASCAYSDTPAPPRRSLPTRPPTRSTPDRGCRDKYTQCKMVIRTTLCSHPYYKSLCCKSCKLYS